MDYLVRDAYRTDVPYDTIGHERPIRELTLVDGELVLTKGNIQTAESLLLARTLMNPVVYQHYAARISKATLRRASKRLLDEDIDTKELRRMDDPNLLVALRLTDSTSAFTERLAARDLYKRTVWTELSNVPNSIIDAEHDALAAFERDVAVAADISPESVILDVPSRPPMTESSPRVMVSDEVQQLECGSPFVQALRTAQERQWQLGAYVPREGTEHVGRATTDVLGLDVDDALVTEVRDSLNVTLDGFE